MSKLSFRARALDANKPMPVYIADEIPDLRDFAAINRAVPQMPTGMEKEEETEHHLQRALSAQQVYGSAEKLVIPIPEIDTSSDKIYDDMYKSDFKMNKQYIHVQAFGVEQEIPDYDMDSDDEQWLNEQDKKMEITSLQFEEMMDRLEKGSGQQVVTLQEAKLLLKEDDDLIIAVYDYWLNKRLTLQQLLIPQVKTEKRDGSTTNNPYVAFRRRTEKMQTRKNRKNDEASYEKMLKLKRDLNRAVTLLEMIKRREKSKKELLQLQIEIVEKRYQIGDFSGELLAKANAEQHRMPSSFLPLNQYNINRTWENREDVGYVRKKREYKKRKHKNHIPLTIHQPNYAQLPQYGDNIDILGHSDMFSSEEEVLSPGLSPSDHEDENDPDGVYAFRRKRGCMYQAPINDGYGNWPWASPSEGGFGDKKYRYCLTSIPTQRRCVGFVRRRVGRGGRILFDRAFTPYDNEYEDIDLCSSQIATSNNTLHNLTKKIKDEKWLHFRPRSPVVNAQTMQTSISPLNVPILSEFNIEESFQNHQEALYAMKAQQQEELLKQQTVELEHSANLEYSFSSQPTSKFTLDTASALFAASAVVNNTQKLLQNGSNGINNGNTHVSELSATSSEGKICGFSTSPAANVLQLNFPLTSNNLDDSLNIPVPSLVSSATRTLVASSTTNTLPTESSIITVNNNTPTSGVNVNKFAPIKSHKAPELSADVLRATTTPQEELTVQNDTSVTSLVKKEHIVPMEVT